MGGAAIGACLLLWVSEDAVARIEDPTRDSLITQGPELVSGDGPPVRLRTHREPQFLQLVGLAPHCVPCVRSVPCGRSVAAMAGHGRSRSVGSSTSSAGAFALDDWDDMFMATLAAGGDIEDLFFPGRASSSAGNAWPPPPAPMARATQEQAPQLDAPADLGPAHGSSSSVAPSTSVKTDPVPRPCLPEPLVAFDARVPQHSGDAPWQLTPSPESPDAAVDAQKPAMRAREVRGSVDVGCPSPEHAPWVLEASQDSDAHKETRRPAGQAAAGQRDMSVSPASSRNSSVAPSEGAARPLAPWAPPLLPPEPLAGIEHWQMPLWRSMEHARMRLPAEPKRPMRVESFCTGLGTEYLGFLALGMRVDLMAAAERKVAARKFLQLNWRGKLQHLFPDNACLAEGGGPCAICLKDCQTNPLPPDLAAGGLPCQAFSVQRQQGGRTARTGPVRGHPSFTATTDGWDAYLAARRPLGFIVEETLSFTRTDSKTGESFTQGFADRCSRAGYAVRTLKMPHGLWSELPRDRCPCSIKRTTELRTRGAMCVSGRRRRRRACVFRRSEESVLETLPGTPRGQGDMHACAHERCVFVWGERVGRYFP